MPEYDTYEAPIQAHIAEVIATHLATELGLQRCEAGDYSELPAPAEFSTMLNAVLVMSLGAEIEDFEVASPAAAGPRPRGYEVQYAYEIVFIRLDQANEDSHVELAEGSRKIKGLFLNGHRRLPGLNQPGCMVLRAVPVSSTPKNPYNEIYDVPEIGAKADVILLHVCTRSLLH